jgi:Zn-dependent protease with chaperone function
MERGRKRGRGPANVNVAMNLAPKRAVQCAMVMLVLVASGPVAEAQRTPLRPGWNMFSPQQDVQIGRQAAADAERKLPLCNDAKVDAYLTELGRKLVAKLPTNGVDYPWEFHCVNDKAINAFALPGGFVFVNRGAIEAADDEAQLAGVMAHELSHVALRHGTNQATKAEAAQGILGIAGGIFGGSVGGALITQLGSFAAGGVLLRYSRSAESQADVMGTQVLYDAGYDPRALAQFFEKLEAESKGKNPPEFFSDHPSPEHRVERVQEEIEKLGGVPANAKKDSPQFEAIKRELLAMPAPAKGAKPGGPVPAPSANLTPYQTDLYSLRYPENWKRYPDSDGKGASFAPDGGIVQTTSGAGALAYGLIVRVDADQGSTGGGGALQEATQKLIDGLKKSNTNMKVTSQSKAMLSGEPALSTYLSNESPAGGGETDWMMTTLRAEGLVYFVCVAPEREFGKYEKACAAVFESVRLPN